MTRQEILSGTVAACAPIAHHFPRRDGEAGGGTLHHIATAGSDPMRDRAAADHSFPEFAALEAARLVLRNVRAVVRAHTSSWDDENRVADIDAWTAAEAELSAHVERVERLIMTGKAAGWQIPPYAQAERRWQEFK